MQKRLSEAVFENLKELIKAKNAAHESMFKFSWKKIPPFSLIFPQVDFVRIVRFMGEVRQNALLQKKFIRENQATAIDDEKTFLEAIPAYVDALAESCDKLAKVAEFKQGILEKTQKRDVFAFNKILKDYEEAQANLVRAGAFVKMAWGNISSPNSHAGN